MHSSRYSVRICAAASAVDLYNRGMFRDICNGILTNGSVRPLQDCASSSLTVVIDQLAGFVGTDSTAFRATTVEGHGNTGIFDAYSRLYCIFFAYGSAYGQIVPRVSQGSASRASWIRKRARPLRAVAPVWRISLAAPQKGARLKKVPVPFLRFRSRSCPRCGGAAGRRGCCRRP